MIFYRTSFRFFAVVMIVAIAGLMLTGCGNDNSNNDTQADQNTPTNSENTGDNVGRASGEIEGFWDNEDLLNEIMEDYILLFAGDTVTDTAAAEGELITAVIATPEGGIVAIRLSGEQLVELSFYVDGSFPTSTLRAEDNSPVDIAIEESEGAFTAVYDNGTSVGFFFMFRARGSYTVSVEAGNTLLEETP